MLTTQQLVIVTLAIASIAMFVIISAKTRQRKWWVHPMNLSRGATSVRNRVEDLRDYPDRFFSYFRMNPATIDHLLSMIKDKIQKRDTVMRKSIDPATRLYVTLHYLATGSSHATIGFHYALGRSTVTSIIFDTCQAIWSQLSQISLDPPATHQQWKETADKFLEMWDFPNTVGAVDGNYLVVYLFACYQMVSIILRVICIYD